MFERVRDYLSGKVPSGIARSSRWSAVRAIYLEKHPLCEICGGSKDIIVHHILPFHVNPELELHDSNLVTLCESKNNGVNCHLLFGHLGNFRRYNPDVLADIAIWKIKLSGG